MKQELTPEAIFEIISKQDFDQSTGIEKTQYYELINTYRGMKLSQLRTMRDLETENEKLKQKNKELSRVETAIEDLKKNSNSKKK
ncbi:hypothetical protein CJD36_016895 [Flavipsychrobacter stenotrophus]|uniref:Uncharacterized protein n=1 Tax=Flavipsychrobacter stenotrophus TaxID=2077091 RepID=A0A2S7SSV9_9BACT|nr:hypothetical protein [Flavipsychrobacter stenotrophus]PQJ09616.1 hypothetical protein CJD36_016895 [Flavipsychrobacter stenotrophus]